MRRAPFFALFLTAAYLVAIRNTANASECTEGQIYVHENYCDRYYKCENGTKHMKQCPDLWLFDTDKKEWKCRFPIIGQDCSNRPYSNTSTKALVGKQRPECKKGQPTRYYAHENFCSKYYKCENGTEELGECTDGDVFDDRVKPEVLSCKPYLDSSGVDCSYRPIYSEIVETCPYKRYEYSFKHKTDCRLYWICSNGKAYPHLCREGKVYKSSEAGKDHCDHSEYANRTDMNCDFETISGIKCPQTPHFYLNHTQFWPKYTKGGIWTSDGKLLQETFLDLKNPRIPYPVNSNPRIPYPFNRTPHCRHYFECILTEDGTRKPRFQLCEWGLVYQPHTQLCVYRKFRPTCFNYYAEKEAQTKYYMDIIHSYKSSL